MTNPTGRSFLSYRRSRHADAAMIIAAQNDVGIPTWQDVQNLAEEPLEIELRHVLEDPLTASALLWLTPEVHDSAVIRSIEIPLILRRARAETGFFVVPCVAGGLQYSDIGSVLKGSLTLEDLSQWNLGAKVEADPIGPIDAARIAQRVLSRRLQVLHRLLPPSEPLRLRLFTRRRAPFEVGTALAIDWARHFDGREAQPDAWRERLLPALDAVARTIAKDAPGRRVVADGLPTLPAAAALGAAFLAPTGVALQWRQYTPGQPDQSWDLGARREECGFVSTDIAGQLDANDAAILVSVNSDVEAAFRNTRGDLPPLRIIRRVSPRGALPHLIRSPGEAVDLAHLVANVIRDAKAKFHYTGRTHLFMAVPAGLAVLVGQLLNTMGPVQTYDHRDDLGAYRAACLLMPGSSGR